MTEERIRGGMCQSTHRYAKANNTYMKNYDKSIEPSYLTYLDACKQFVWMGNVSKITCEWFYMGKKFIRI